MKTSNKVSQIEKAGIYTLAKLEDFGIAEGDVKEFRANAIVEVTPDLARTLLERNESNRTPTQGRISSYAKQMLAGEWTLNGETIKIDNEGRLIDGQNRLSAVVKAGVAVTMEISVGMPTTSFTTIDTGKCRTAGDIVSIYGKQNASVIAAALKMIIEYERGFSIGRSNGRYSDSSVGNARAFDITNKDIEMALTKYANIEVFLPQRKQVQTLGYKPLFAALHYLMSTYDSEMAEKFFTNLYHGEFMQDGKLKRDAKIKDLREELMRMYANRHDKRNCSTWTIASMVIKTWNGFVTGSPVRTVRVKAGEKQQRIIDPYHIHSAVV